MQRGPPGSTRTDTSFPTRRSSDLQIRLGVIGKISGHIGTYRNVTKISFAEDLGEFYRQSAIAMCPMLGGTGVKVKVVEALSYGLPVECTRQIGRAHV